MSSVYSFSQLQSDIETIAKELPKDFDAIVALGRGGLIPATLLSYRLGARRLCAMQTFGYEDRDFSGSVELLDGCKIESAKRLLVVDDIIDSGASMASVLGYLRQTHRDTEIKTFSLFYKKIATITPDWYMHEATEWIEFFWEEG